MVKQKDNQRAFYSQQTSHIRGLRNARLIMATAFVALLLFICIAPVIAEDPVAAGGWTDWTDPNSLPMESGNYILQTDVTLTSTWSVPSGTTTLDLNGYDITQTAKSASVIQVNSSATLTIDDTAGEGKITGGKAGGIYVDGGTFIFKGGDITDNIATSSSGGGVRVFNGGSFTQVGGKITNNSADVHGGGVYVHSSNFTQEGGDITGNSASNNGGGVYVSGNFTLAGGNIAGNNASYGGGGVYVDGGNFTLAGGNVMDNNAVEGGGVSVNSSSNFTLVSGNIAGNTADISGGGVNVFKGIFTMSGGNITDNKATDSGSGVDVFMGILKVSGNAVIDENNDVYLDNDRVINVTGETFTGSILNITGESLDGGKTVVSIDEGSKIEASDIISQFKLQDTSLKLEADATNKNLIVNDGGVTELPTASGTYYLKDNISITEAWTIAEGVNITLDLRGHDIVMDESDRVINVTSGATLTIIDTEGEGKITGGNTTTNGAGVSVGGNFTLAGGNITGNNASQYGGGVDIWGGNFTQTSGNIAGNRANYGGGVCVWGVSFTLEGGNIADNIANFDGGGVYINGGNFTQTGGNVAGNKALYGDGVCVNGGTFAVSEKAVIDENNEVYLNQNKVITVTGETFTGSVLKITGESLDVGDTVVSIDEGSSIKASDIISQFKLQDTSLKLEADGDKKLVVAENIIPVVDTLPDVQGNYILESDITLTDTWNVPLGIVNLDLNGHVIKPAFTGKNIINITSGAELNLSDSNSSAEHRFKVDAETGLWILDPNGDKILSGGVITGSNGASGIYVDGGKLVMSDVNIIGNTGEFGSGVYLNNSATFTMTGGNINGNNASDCGGAVYVRDGIFKMSGGNIKENRAPMGSAVYVDPMVSGTFEMSGGNITDNIVTSTYGGSVGISDDAKFVLSGDAKIDNNAVIVDENEYPSNVYLFKDAKLTLGEDGLGSNAHIGVTTHVGPTIDTPVLIAEDVTKENAACFFADNGTQRIKLDEAEGKLYLADNWEYWTKTDSLPSSNGSYVLKENVMLKETWNVLSGTSISLNLNGKVISTKSDSVIDVESGANLIIIDKSNEKHYFTVGEDGLWTLSEKATEHSVTGGVITGGKNTGVMVEGNLIIFGGNIVGNKATGDGGGMHVYDGSVKIFGGNISGNVAMYGAGVYLESDHDKTSFEMYGGNITGNTATERGAGIITEGCNITLAESATITADNDINLNPGDVIIISGDAETMPFKGSALNIGLEDEPKLGDVVVQIYEDCNIKAADIIGQFKLSDKRFILEANETLNALVVAEGRTPITDDMVRIGDSELVYTGSEINVTVIVKLNDETTLIEGEDYKLSGNVATAAGNYTVNVTGIGKYNGEISKSWKVLPKGNEDISASTSPEFEPVYDGSVITVSAIVKDVAKVLEEGTDYKLKGDYANATAGTHIASINLTGNYTGSIPLEWTIAKRVPTADNITINSPLEINYDGEGHEVNLTGAEGLGKMTVSYNGDEILVPMDTGDYIITVDIAEGQNYTAAQSIELGKLVIKPVSKEEPELPDIKPAEDGSDGVLVPEVAENATIKVEGKNITIEDNTSGVVLEIEFENTPSETADKKYGGVPKNVVAYYPESPMIPSEKIGDDLVGEPGDAMYQLNLTLGTNVTTELPTINATMNTSVKDDFASKGKELMTMFTTEGSNTEAINNNLSKLEVVLTFKVSWYNKMNKGVFWYHRAEDGTILHEEQIHSTDGNVDLLTKYDGIEDYYRVTITVTTPPFFSGYGLYGMFGTDPTPSPSPRSGGTSVWLTETPTQTVTPTPTETPDKNTTNTTIPTSTAQPTSGAKTPAPLLGVLAGLGIVGVLLRRK